MSLNLSTYVYITCNQKAKLLLHTGPSLGRTAAIASYLYIFKRIQVHKTAAHADVRSRLWRATDDITPTTTGRLIKMDTSPPPPHAAKPSTSSSVANKPKRPTTLRLIGPTAGGDSDQNDALLLSPPPSDDSANGRPASASVKYKYAVFFRPGTILLRRPGRRRRPFERKRSSSFRPSSSYRRNSEHCRTIWLG